MLNKLSTEELKELIQLKEDYNSVVFTLGDITAKIEEAELNLAELNDSKRSYLQTYKILSEKDKSLAHILTDKYGSGQINLETGQITR